MSDTKPPADALAKQLKDSLARRRLRPWKLVLPAVLGCTSLLVLLTWWLYPRAKAASLQIVALDIVYTSNETPRACALLHAPSTDKEPRRLSGGTVVFREQRLMLQPNEKPREIVTTSDARGQASVEWPVAHPGLAEFLVLYIDTDERKGSPHELGRIFVWPKDAPLLLVDADETLIAAELDAQAAETLTTAAKEGWRIVYLSLASTQAHEFRTARGWIHKNQTKLPMGPVLGRKSFGDDVTVAQARRDVLQSLHSRFTGKMLALVKTAEAAQISREIGLPTILIGNAAAPAEVVQAPTWADVVVRLK
jgi:hypothetical protein